MTPFVLPLLVWSLAMARELWRDASAVRLLGGIAGGLGIVALSWAVGLFLGQLSGFGLMTLVSWLIFVVSPVLCAVVAVRGGGPTRALAGFSGAALVAVAVQAFLVEPNMIELSEVRIESALVTEPLRIVLVADVQTDHVGRHEAQAFAEVVAAQPDLVVFTGDHIQLPAGPAFERQAAEHARLLRESGLKPRLGAFAVRGDIDPAGWPAAFEGTGVTVLKRSERLDLGELVLTALSPQDSRSPAPPVGPAAGLHVVMGHSPDYALAQPDADLLLAGHTHGGQVVVPFFGPPLTMAAVPRAWASGHTVLPWGGDLIVSRGIGVERQDAPRLRFLCPPEVVIIDVVPATRDDTGPAVAEDAEAR